MKHLKKYWKQYKWLFFLSVFCVSCEAACDLLQPKLMSRLIDEGAVKQDLDYIAHTGLAMLSVAGAGAIFAVVRNISASMASQKFGAELRHDIFAKIQSFSVDEMERFEGGSLVTRMTSDITQMQNFANGMMRIFFKAPLMCAGAIIMAATLNYKTIPIIAAAVVLVGVVIGLSMKMTYPRFAKIQKALDGLNTAMREYLAGIRLVKAFRRFDEEERRFCEANNNLADSTVKANRLLAIFSPCMALFVNFGVAALIFLGAHWIDAGDMRVGEIMAFVAYMAQILGSLNMISNVLNMFVRVKTSNGRIREVFEIGAGGASGLKTPAPFAPEKNDSPPKHQNAHIAFDEVSFEYGGSTGQAALSGLNFFVGRGETLGIIGPTGSGKSTLASLLMHFYGVSKGALFISGIPIDSIPESALREKIAIVPQTASLFAGTIKENILWGEQNATEIQIEQAAKAAEAHDFISAMPDGYETAVGQSGVNLSGGQKQRISIARALMRKPEILILDDCTSALDVMTEAKVKKAIEKLSDNMTCILITQRVAAAMGCDKILVLDSGRQAGFGSHGELMESCPVYYEIYMSQIGRRGRQI